jgi:polyisoprenoid-binding protein YceI
MFKAIGMLALVGVAVLVGAGALLFLRPPAAPSAPMQATPLQVGQAELTTYSIQPGAAHARFRVFEILRGEPNTVLGETDQVAGQFALNLAEPSSAHFGPITINARTFATDSAQRDRALRSFILNTDEYEYLTFTPSALLGLPATVEVGGSYPVQIVGQLTIKDVTREVTFDATVTPRSATELSGTARTTVHYPDWGLAVPDLPFLAGVADDAELELEFVATAS